MNNIFLNCTNFQHSSINTLLKDCLNNESETFRKVSKDWFELDFEHASREEFLDLDSE